MEIHAIFDLRGESTQIGSPGGAVRVRLAGERADIARRLAGLLAEAGGTEVPAAAGTPQPVVLLLDRPSLDSRENARPPRSARQDPPERVLWYLDAEPASEDGIRVLIQAAKRGWCCGYVAGDISPAMLARAVCAVAQDEIWLPRALLARAVLASPRLHADLGAPQGATEGLEQDLTRLTMREREVLRLVRRGLTNKEIGRYLGVVEDTVKKHLRNMYAKLGVHRRAQMLLRVVGQARASR